MDYILVISPIAGGLFAMGVTYVLLSSKLKFKEEQLANLSQDKENLENSLHELQSRFETLREENLGIQTLLSGMEEKKEMLQERLVSLQLIQDKYAQSVAESAELRVRLEEEKSQNAQKLALLKNAEEEMKLQFSKLANDIFEQKSKVHAEQNKLQLDTILKPFQEQVNAFGKKIEENYVTETKERHLLKDQIVQFRSLNERLSDDANNLTKALKGENKTQGNWGELILGKDFGKLRAS